jgi:hypothetical protein
LFSLEICRQEGNRISVVAVLFPKRKSAENHHFSVRWRKAGTGWRHPRIIILGCGHANRSYIRQILNIQGTERFSTAHPLENGVLHAR